MTYSTGRTSSAGSDLMYRPRPHSWSTTNVTDARHSPSGHRTHPSIEPDTQAPSCKTRTCRAGSIRLTASDTILKVGQE